jgi:4-hydroxy-2-oxoheptanedioate aldolase
VLCIVMIETRDAVGRVDEILSVPGIDAVYVGPADLSITLGLPPAPDHDAASFTDAIARILESCLAHGVVPGIAGNQKTAPKRVEQGFRLVEVASDARLLGVGAGAALQAVAPDGGATSRSAYL